MIRLVEAPNGALQFLLPGARDAAGWHAVLVAEITQHLSAAHAMLLARPERTQGGWAWTADGAARVRYADLDAAARQELDVALGAILSDIRRLAESGAAPAVREAWPRLREAPDMGHVFAVDGRPVIAAWGHAGGDGAALVGARLARLDDGVVWRAKPQPAWVRYGVAAGTLAALALLAGLLMPFAARWLVPAPAACAIVPGQLEAMRAQLEAEGRGQELQTLLASLTEEVGRRQLLCPIRVVPGPAPAPAPRPAPTPAAPPPAPPPRADLPQDQWNRRDLSVLEGCWNLVTGLKVGEGANAVPIKTWKLCFDRQGAGTHNVVLTDGRKCEGPLRAEFLDGDRLRITEPRACSGTLSPTPVELTCKRESDAEALCNGRNIDPSNLEFSGRFRR